MKEREIRTASRFYKELFETKVYKIALDAGCTCPNRDGSKGTGGCIFCSENGSGDFASSSKLSVKKQIENAKQLIAPKLKKSSEVKYIAYFQSFTSTYGNPKELIKKYKEALSCQAVIGITIATRPDCLNEEILMFLSEIAEEHFVSIELGLQTSNEKTGELINRCYTNEDFINASQKIKSYSSKIHLTAHVIFGLPGETEEDMLETVKFCANCKIDGIKFTVLHVLKKTKLEKMYEEKLFECLSMEKYFNLLYKALNLLSKNIVIHRLTGDGPKSILIAPLWTMDKKNVHNQMKKFFLEKGFYL